VEVKQILNLNNGIKNLLVNTFEITIYEFANETKNIKIKQNMG
jgi:hypothetical protein